MNLESGNKLQNNDESCLKQLNESQIRTAVDQDNNGDINKTNVGELNDSDKQNNVKLSIEVNAETKLEVTASHISEKGNDEVVRAQERQVIIQCSEQNATRESNKVSERQKAEGVTKDTQGICSNTEMQSSRIESELMDEADLNRDGKKGEASATAKESQIAECDEHNLQMSKLQLPDSSPMTIEQGTAESGSQLVESRFQVQEKHKWNAEKVVRSNTRNMNLEEQKMQSINKSNGKNAKRKRKIRQEMQNTKSKRQQIRLSGKRNEVSPIYVNLIKTMQLEKDRISGERNQTRRRLEMVKTNEWKRLRHQLQNEKEAIKIRLAKIFKQRVRSKKKDFRKRKRTKIKQISQIRAKCSENENSMYKKDEGYNSTANWGLWLLLQLYKGQSVWNCFGVA